MMEKNIEGELCLEFQKNRNELIKDIIREANTLPENTASEIENLDIIKHLIKRLAIHQVSLDDSAKRMNNLLIFLSIIMTILSFIMAIGAIYTVLSFYKLS